MNHYHHLTIEEREMILSYSAKGISICKISKILNRNKSTVSRELKRNAFDEQYSLQKLRSLF